MCGGADEDVSKVDGGQVMARFSFDFDIDGIMQSIEDELAEIIQSELDSVVNKRGAK